ncbi:MAG: DNA polymerase III subunit delta' [Planctomycetota bacterium]|nr:DNA polymerase III subunit delta' [Planctomycetota bacterium]
MPSTWDDFRGHGEQVEMFRRAIARGRLSQGYLFAGPAGVGKRTFARKLATCLFCERHEEYELEACGHCRSCRQMAGGSHPDYFEVGCPEGKRELPISVFLGEEDERGRAGLCYQLSLSPISGGRRFAVINDADAMNDAAANAFLKTLEEPQPGAILVLIAQQPDELLPTIRSRCQLVRFAPLATADIVALLLANGVTTDQGAAWAAANVSEGSLEVASRLVDPALISLRQTIIEELSKQPFDPSRTAERLVKGIEPFSDQAAQREATGWIARFAATFFRQVAHVLIEPATADEAAAAFADRLLRATGDDAEAVERLTALIDRAAAVEDQLSLYASPVLCIESFAYDAANRLRG